MNLEISELTPIQKEALEKFKKLKVGALFMEMGTGKTLTTLELINYNKNNIDYILWFTPCSTKENLAKEIKKWGFNFTVNIFGWETLSQSDNKYFQLLEDISNKKLFIVADESIFIKNQDTKRYKRLMNIAKNSEYRLILNGTPITKNEWDIYYQIKFLSPKIINMNESEFLNTFYKKIRYKKKGQKENSFYILSDINIDYLHNLINPYIINAKFKFNKKEINDTILVYPDEDTQEKYQKQKNNSLDNLVNFNSEEIIKMINNLNIISSTDKNKALEIAKYSKNKRVIVFCNYLYEVKEICSNLTNFFKITGDVKRNEREIIINEFENNNIPLVMTFGTGSFGLNLQKCNEIIFSSLTFDYAKIKQAKGRIRRIGQEKDIKYTYFDVQLPINEFIAKNIDKKEYLNELIIKKLKENNEK